MWLPNMPNTNRPVQSQKMARFKNKRNCTIRVAKTKALISFTVTAKLICAFVSAYAVCLFSHEAAHMLLSKFRQMLADIHPFVMQLFKSSILKICLYMCMLFYDMLVDI